MKKRIALFGDGNSHITSILYDSFINNIHNKFELVAVINTTPIINNLLFNSILLYIIKKLFNPFDRNINFSMHNSFLKNIDKNINVIHVSDVNSAEFINKMKCLEVNYAFLMGCPQIFKYGIIECFDKVINYHNSYLPTYRGLDATRWAMTYGEKYTGYTFHYINEKIDDGRILFQEKIELDYSISSNENEILKTKKASQKLKVIFDMVYKNYAGISQVGKASYYGTKQKNMLLHLSSLEDKKYIEELIKIWGYIEFKNKEEKIIVTQLSQHGKIERINYLPVWMYSYYRILKKGMGNWKK